MTAQPWQSHSPMFRSLTAAEVEDFEGWAGKNDPPSDDWGFYHPVCQESWFRRGLFPSATTWRVCGSCGEDFKSHNPLCPICGSNNTWMADEDCVDCGEPVLDETGFPVPGWGGFKKPRIIVLVHGLDLEEEK